MEGAPSPLVETKATESSPVMDDIPPEAEPSAASLTNKEEPSDSRRQVILRMVGRLLVVVSLLLLALAVRGTTKGLRGKYSGGESNLDVFTGVYDDTTESPSNSPSTSSPSLTPSSTPSTSAFPSLAPSASVIPSQTPTKCNEPLPSDPLPGKKGIGLKLGEDNWQTNLPLVLGLNPSWNYSWGPRRIAAQPDHIEFIPMIWGAWGEAGVRRRVEEDIVPAYEAGLIKRFLAFNEPDIKLQSNLAVEDVVGYWPILQGAGIPLASPSVGHPLGSWMKDFMTRVEAQCLRVEYTALHWYGPPNANKFKSDMTEAYYLYGERPLLITEFAPADWQATTVAENKWSETKVLDFMKEVVPWLERQPFVLGYAWFPFKIDRPQGASSALYANETTVELTACGRFYASVTTENPDGNQTITV